MEIYSPKSKKRELFKKNQLKSKVTEVEKPEIETIKIENFEQVPIKRRPNPIVSIKQKLVDSLKDFFEVSEYDVR